MSFIPPSGFDQADAAKASWAPATLVGFCAPTATTAGEVHQPGAASPGSFRLQGFRPSWRFPPSPACRSRGPAPLMGFTLQSVSPPRSRTPFGALTLLPFLASRAPALRTRSSRCPAAPGLCSPRRSVHVTGRGPDEPMLSWAFSPLQSGPRAAVVRLPEPVLPALSRSRPRGGRPGGAPRNGRTHGQAGLSRVPPTLLRFSTRTCPRFLPTTVASCRNDPTGSEKICTDGPRGTRPVGPEPPGEEPGGTLRHPPPTHL